MRPGDDDRDDDFDPEGPDPSEMDPEDGLEVFDCPKCGKPVHEQSEWCPHCGTYLTEEDKSPPPKWIVIGAAVGIVATVGYILIRILQ